MKSSWQGPQHHFGSCEVPIGVKHRHRQQFSIKGKDSSILEGKESGENRHLKSTIAAAKDT